MAVDGKAGKKLGEKHFCKRQAGLGGKAICFFFEKAVVFGRVILFFIDNDTKHDTCLNFPQVLDCFYR